MENGQNNDFQQNDQQNSTKKETPRQLKEEKPKTPRQLQQEKLIEERKNKGGFGKRVPKTDQNEIGWEELELDEVKISKDKPLVLAFGGSGTDSAQDANFMCKFVEELVGPAKDNGYDLYGFYYAKSGRFDEEQQEKIIKCFVEPLIKDENGDFFDEKTIKENLGRLRFVSYCRGATETSNLLEGVAKLLEEQYSPKQTKEMLSHVLVVAFAPEKFGEFGQIVGFCSEVDHDPSLLGYNFTKTNPDTMAEIQPMKKQTGVMVVTEEIGGKKPEHSIQNILKDRGVINRDMLKMREWDLNKWSQYTKFKKEHPNELPIKPDGISRQQAISDMFGSVLSYGLVTTDPKLSEVTMILQALVSQEDKLESEKDMKKQIKTKRQCDNLKAKQEELVSV